MDSVSQQLIDLVFQKLSNRKKRIGLLAIQELEKMHGGEIDAGLCGRCLAELPSKISDKDMLQSVLLTHRLHTALKTQKPLKTGSFSYLLSGEQYHPDCPIQYEIRDAKRQRIATIGFLLQAKGKQTSLRLTNIQGVAGAASQLQALSAERRENWRVSAARFIKRAALRQGVHVVGVLPRLFYTTIPTSPGAYQRTVRQYQQTFRKVGIQEVDARHVKPYPAKWKKVHQRLRKNLHKHLRKLRP